MAVEDLNALRARELKARLMALGVDTSNVFEKAELVRLLGEAGPGGAGSVLPLRRFSTKPGFGGVQASSAKVYRGFDVELVARGGERVPFVIDTASSNTLVSPAFAQRLGGTSTTTAVTGSSATGAMSGLSLVRLGDCAIAGVGCGPLDAVVMDLPLADDDRVGLLGLDVLQRVDLELDFARDSVRFAPAGTLVPSSGEAWEEVPVEVNSRGLLTASVRVRSATGQGVGTEAPAIVDTGSSTTVANWAAAVAAGIERSDARLTGEGVVGVAGEAIPVAEADALLSFSGQPDAGQARPVTLSVGDLPIFDAMGMSTSPIIVTGLDVLGAERVALSVTAGRMWIAAAVD